MPATTTLIPPTFYHQRFPLPDNIPHIFGTNQLVKPIIVSQRTINDRIETIAIISTGYSHKVQCGELGQVSAYPVDSKGRRIDGYVRAAMGDGHERLEDIWGDDTNEESLRLSIQLEGYAYCRIISSSDEPYIIVNRGKNIWHMLTWGEVKPPRIPQGTFIFNLSTGKKTLKVGRGEVYGVFAPNGGSGLMDETVYRAVVDGDAVDWKLMLRGYGFQIL